MRILGIDYGSKRVGLAISDEGGSFAFPKDVLVNDDMIFNNLARIIEEENVEEIVVGDPGENLVAEEVKNFVEKIKENFSLPVHLEKEFMTSLHVSQFLCKKPIARKEKKERGEKRDDSAAALILQRFLDKK